MRRTVVILPLLLVLCCAGSFLAAQVVPYGRAHANPPVVKEPNWDSPRTRALSKRACYDCHSNETVWPWYSNIAPVSWLVQHDVEEGRSSLNFSEWTDNSGEMDALIETVREGAMPPGMYVLQHPGARLSPQETEQLIAGYQQTFPTAAGNH